MALLAGTVAVVSGVGPGLGRSIALACAREGADVVLAARTTDRLDEVAKEVTSLRRRALAVPAMQAVASESRPAQHAAIGLFLFMRILASHVCSRALERPAIPGGSQPMLRKV